MRKLLSIALLLTSLATNAFAVCDSPKLLLHANGTDASTTFTDSSASAHTVTAVGNAQLDTAQKKFGTASGLFDGTGDYLTIPDSEDWNVGTGNFTLDMWIRWSSVTSDKIIWELGTRTSDGFSINPRAAAGVTEMTFNNTGFSFTLDSDWVQDQWYHVELTRSGNELRWYRDGVQQDTTKSFTEAISGTTTGVVVAALQGGTAPFTGWIDEVHFVKGGTPHTSNFTPPTAEYCSGTSAKMFSVL